MPARKRHTPLVMKTMPPEGTESEVRAEFERQIDIASKAERHALDWYNAMRAIKERRLWYYHFQSWNECCESVFRRSKDQVDRLIEHSIVMDQLSKDGQEMPPRGRHSLPGLPNSENGQQVPPPRRHPLPNLTEYHTRELIKAHPAKRAEIVQKVAERHNGKVTAKAIRKAVDEERAASMPPKPPPVGMERLKPKTVEAMQAAAQFHGVARDLQGIKQKLIDLAESEPGFFLRAGLNSHIAELKNVWNAIRFAAPHSDCVICGQRGKNCEACLEQGWLPKGRFEAMPADNRRRSLVLEGKA